MRRLTQQSSERPDPPKQKSLHIGFVLAKDITLSALSLFIDTLRLASDEGDRSGRVHCDWEVISSTYEHIRSNASVEIAPNALLGDPTRFTHIAVVGRLLSSKAPIDSQTKAFFPACSNENSGKRQIIIEYTMTLV